MFFGSLDIVYLTERELPMLSAFFLATFSAIILEGEPKAKVLAAKPSIISTVSGFKNESPKTINLYSDKGQKYINIAVTTLKKEPVPAPNINREISGWSKDMDLKDLKEGDPNPTWMK